MATVTDFAKNSVEGRKIASIVGAIVADAAAQPLHWIYNLERLNSLIANVEDIEFRDPSANPFYRILTGSNTCYGDQLYTMLKSLVESQGLSISNLKEVTYKAFGPDSVYEDAENAKYEVGKEDKINVKKTYPINNHWRNGCIKEFLANMEKGSEETGAPNDDQIDCALRIIPLVCLYAGRDDMLAQVEKGLRVTQSSDLALAAALAMARVLEQYILNGDPQDVLNTVINSMESPQNPSPQELDKAVIGHIRRVDKVKAMAHFEAVNTQFKNN